MGSHGFLSCVLLVLAAAPALAEDATGALAERVQTALARTAPKLGTEFQAVPGAPHVFAASLSRGLETCDRIDLEVRVRDGSALDVVAYPRVGGERLDPRRAADRPALLRTLEGSTPRIAPFAWATEAEAAIHAACAFRWAGASAPDDLERILLAANGIDRQVAELMRALAPPLTDEELTAKLREASAADEARRNAILASLAPYLPEVAVSATPGQSTFRKMTLNRRGASFDAFRFRVPAEGGDRRLVWAFAYPPGTAKGWYIAPVAGAAPKFVKFHRGRPYKGTGVPAEHATLLQRTETPLRAGAEYVLWFQFKVETPVDLFVALGCIPYVKSDRDAPAVLEDALGLQPAR